MNVSSRHRYFSSSRAQRSGVAGSRNETRIQRGAWILRLRPAAFAQDDEVAGDPLRGRRATKAVTA